MSADEATDMFVDMIKHRPLTYIVVDALDECDRSKRDKLLDYLIEILSRSTSRVKMFVTSRYSHMDITLRMKSFPAVSIDATRNHADIDYYVKSSVRDAIDRGTLLPTEKVGYDLQTQIEDSLRHGAQGMYVQITHRRVTTRLTDDTSQVSLGRTTAEVPVHLTVTLCSA
jgi:hypothetical protein